MRRLLAFALVFGILLVGAAAPATAQDTLKIGAPQPMTGPDAPFGDKFKKAYGMAVEEINAKGGVNGKKIEVIIDDHQAKNAMAATVRKSSSPRARCSCSRAAAPRVRPSRSPPSPSD